MTLCVRTLVAALLLFSTARAQSPAAVDPASIWIDVPYVHQPHEGCGAASLAMVMMYWAAKGNAGLDKASDVAVIQRELYSPRDHGIPADRMRDYLRKNNFQAFALNAVWSDIADQLRKGRPLIVALKPQGQSELHYVVVDGIDTARGLVTVNDPAERKLMTRERAGFEKEWNATHNWMLLAVPASKTK